MIEFHGIWEEQCAAAREIREEFGVEKALGYLVGEKLAAFVKEADEREDFRRELPRFVAEVKRIFSPPEIAAYLAGVKRLGAMGHVLSDEQYAFFVESGTIKESPSAWAEDILMIERIKGLLLD